ncbi:unnamed protein product [Cylicocyclus nassatus]|uniref:Uncharacterized protein n=1 Tax=Cylicocyclus nassatus TaxID=53992 RepID=A0AA36DSU9_CYLNA|nr:unnamed protein product [Cylicocyclus nassatus]
MMYWLGQTPEDDSAVAALAQWARLSVNHVYNCNGDLLEDMTLPIIYIEVGNDARITFDFWRTFMAEGRKTLYENNSKNGTDIKIIRERTLSLEDQDRLGLFIRKSIKDACARKNKKCIDITLKKSLIKIGNNEPVNPAVASVLLNLDLSSWTGLPVEELLSKQEKTKIQVQSSSHLKKRPIDVIEEEPPKKKALAWPNQRFCHVLGSSNCLVALEF